MTKILVSGTFDHLQGRDVRFLEEAAKLGPLHVLLVDDPDARFPLAERRYCLEALRCVEHVREAARGPLRAGSIQEEGIWAWPEWEDSSERAAWFEQNHIPYREIALAQLAGFPEPGEPPQTAPGRKKVIVTGCFDYFHSGHVRFFEEASAFGDLYVAVGSDANVRFLKGEGHPLFPQDERRYLVGSVRFVHQALIGSGSGWMDAAPEIARLRPDIYLVNEDGDKPEKRQFCAEHGLEYVVLQRRPAPGLPQRSSTDLRGF